MPDTQQHIDYGSKTITFDLSFETRKSLGIRVFPDGKINVKAPIDTAIEKVFEKIKLKAPWILKQQDFFQTFNPLTPDRKYINGETHLYLGRQYKLRIMNYELEKVKFDRNFLTVFTNNNSSENVKKILEKWYKEKAKEWFAKLLPECLDKFSTKEKLIIHNSSLIIEVRSMQKRWGSCTQAGKIILNPDLVKAPKGSIEYVIIHELCHLVHHRHNKAFFDLQERIMPDWKKWKDKLEYCLA